MPESRNDNNLTKSPEPALAVAELPPPTRARPKPNRTLAKLQCRRCLHTMEVPAEQLRTSVRCPKCHTSLRTPKSIRQSCPYCGACSDFSAHASGRRVKCCQCGVRLQIPVQVARPQRRRRRYRSSRRTHPEVSLIPLIISLGVSVIGLVLCFRLLAIL